MAKEFEYCQKAQWKDKMRLMQQYKTKLDNVSIFRLFIDNIY